MVHKYGLGKEVEKMDVKFPIGHIQFPDNLKAEHIKKWLSIIESYTTRLREGSMT